MDWIVLFGGIELMTEIRNRASVILSITLFERCTYSVVTGICNDNERLVAIRRKQNGRVNHSTF